MHEKRILSSKLGIRIIMEWVLSTASTDKIFIIATSVTCDSNGNERNAFILLSFVDLATI